MVPRSAARYESRIGEAPIGIWAGVGSVALPAGPLLGGLLVHGLGWRWVFAINVPIVAVGGLLAARVVASDSETGPGRIDRAGTALAAGALATATYAVIEAGRAGVGPAVIASALVAITAAIAFCRVELRVDRPMLPLQLFRRPAFSTANAVAGAMNFGTLGLLFLLTLFLQDVQGRDALHAGLALLPLFLPLSILAPVTGRVVGRFGPKPVMIAGLLLAAAGIGLVATWQVHTEYAALLPALLGWGIGLGLLTPAVTTRPRCPTLAIVRRKSRR